MAESAERCEISGTSAPGAGQAAVLNDAVAEAVPEKRMGRGVTDGDRSPCKTKAPDDWSAVLESVATLGETCTGTDCSMASADCWDTEVDDLLRVPYSDTGSCCCLWRCSGNSKVDTSWHLNKYSSLGCYCLFWSAVSSWKHSLAWVCMLAALEM